MAMLHAPSFKNIGTDLITLVVGTNRQSHVVHKDLLTSESPYFRAMFNGAWKESSLQQPIEIESARDDVFVHFLDWLYFRKLASPVVSLVGSETCAACGGKCAEGPDPTEIQYEIEELTQEDDVELEEHLQKVTSGNYMVHLYIFADRFDVPGLREVIVSKVWQRYAARSAWPAYSGVCVAFRALPISSPLCRLLADACASGWSALADQICPSEQKLRAKMPANFYFILAAKIQAKASGSRTETIGEICEYHEHGSDEEAKANCKQGLKEISIDAIVKCRDWEEVEKVRANRFLS